MLATGATQLTPIPTEQTADNLQIIN